jgi:cell division protein FtsZ
MTLNLSLPNNPHEIKPRITVIGVGGAGGNAVSNMIRSNLEGVEFIIANTDAQALAQSQCARRIQLGHGITQGLGAGSRPDIGRAAAEESIDSVIEELAGSNMVFITAGMGGGTGTGAAPVVARAAREHGILTVGVVTKPFHFEGLHRMRLADSGIQELQQYVDTLIIIPNQNLFRIATEKTTFADAFAMADQVLYSGVRGVTDLMVMPGLINLDFADIRSVMTEMGKAMMGTGEAEGESRAVTAAERAISNPLLDDVSMKGARGVLINITGGPDMTLFEVDEAATRIREEVDPEANIIFGSTFDQDLTGKIRISVVATGIEAVGQAMPRPVSLSLVAAGGRVVSAPAHQPAEAAPVLRAERREMAETAPAAVMSAQPATAGALAMAMETQPAMPAPRAAMPAPAMAAPAMAAAATSSMPAPAVSRPPQTDAGMSLALDLAAAAAPTVATPAPAMVPPAPPMAAPRMSEDRPFIAPAPAERAAAATPRPTMPTMTPPAMTAPAAPTMAAPAMTAARVGAPAAAPEAPRRGTNLFARVTGSSGLFGRAPKTEPALPPAPGPAPAPAVRSEPAPRLQAPAMPAPPAAHPVAQPRAAATPPAPQPGEAQQRLAGLDPKDRIATTRAEEEFFEIPAFLRRQAN